MADPALASVETPVPPNDTPTPREIQDIHADLLKAQIDYMTKVLNLLPSSYCPNQQLMLQLLVNSANNTLNDMTCLTFIIKSVIKK